MTQKKQDRVVVETGGVEYQLLTITEAKDQSLIISVLDFTSFSHAVAVNNVTGTRTITHSGSTSKITEAHYSVHTSSGMPDRNMIKFTFVDDTGHEETLANKTPAIKTHGLFVPLIACRQRIFGDHSKILKKKNTAISLGTFDQNTSSLIWAIIAGPPGVNISSGRPPMHIKRIPGAIADLFIVYTFVDQPALNGNTGVALQPWGIFDDQGQPTIDAFSRPWDEASMYEVLRGFFNFLSQ